MLLALLQGCDGRQTASTSGPAEAPAAIIRDTGYAELPGWDEDDLAAALPAWRASCEALSARPSDQAMAANGLGGTVGDWLAPCRAIPDPGSSAAAIRRYVEAWFVPVAISGTDGGQGLFTGYYEPELTGTRQRGAAYPVPLYRRPAGLVEVDGQIPPYYTRAEIDGGALSGEGLELLWLTDAVEAFFLQVQGSGRVRLAEGGSVRVGYAANNGHPYTAIGRILIERGELTKETASLQTIRRWLRDHPGEATALMQSNARYIFFREIAGEGPIGSLGVVLTPGRSLAVDADHIPLGAPIWLDTTYPAGTPEVGLPLRRLMVAQDTGGAIKGAVRGDIYWGSGEVALIYAGPMKQRGRYYLLLPSKVAASMNE